MTASPSAPTAGNAVGPVLVADSLGRAVAEAICKRQPDATIVDRGAYLRVSRPGTCVLEASDVEELTGASFSLPADLERVMPSFAGRLSFEERRAAWSSPAPKEVR